MEQLDITFLHRIWSVALIVFYAVAIRYAVERVNQNWIKTFSHTVTLILLPIVTYSITSVISGNIALSLGMVGALSIVRFRNPVKSPFELAIYFLMISIGICASVNINWMLFLGTTTVVTLLGIDYITKYYRKSTGKDLFTASFSEGNSLNVVSIETDAAIETLQLHDGLIAMSSRDNMFTYRLVSADKAELLATTKDYTDHANVKAIEFNAA